MNRIQRFAVSASLLALATACGDDTVTNQTVTTSQSASDNMAATMPTGPFAEVETSMNERMMAATGANASETWARKMIEHHRGAVAMSQLLVDRGGDPRLVDMARMTVEKQNREIGELERLIAAGLPGGEGQANPFGPIEQRMHQQMMAAGADDLSESWARKMIAHHQGAIDLSEALIAQGGNPQALVLARRFADDQREEIAQLNGILSGQAAPAPAPAQAPAAGPVVPAPARPDRAPPTAPKAAPAPRPAVRTPPPARPAPKQEPVDPHAGHNMTTMNPQ